MKEIKRVPVFLKHSVLFVPINRIASLDRLSVCLFVITYGLISPVTRKSNSHANFS